MKVFILTQINGYAELLYAKAFPTKEEAKAEMKRQYQGILATACEDEDTQPTNKGFKDKEAYLVWYYSNDDIEEALQWDITESDL